MKSWATVLRWGSRAETFRSNGVEYRQAEMTTSDYYAGFQPILNSGRVRLLDNKRLSTQLCSLERRQSRIGAKDSIGHPFGMTIVRRLSLPL